MRVAINYNEILSSLSSRLNQQHRDIWRLSLDPVLNVVKMRESSCVYR
jgi:Txe/YoeB family toxin of Txe-Axe toxin-antitoxin module